jgi:hypothetical protein
MTKSLLVSIALPGPISVLHQPSGPVATASPVSAWQTKTALEASSFSVPAVV